MEVDIGRPLSELRRFKMAAEWEEDRGGVRGGRRPAIPRNDFGRMNVLLEERSAPVSTLGLPLPV